MSQLEVLEQTLSDLRGQLARADTIQAFQQVGHHARELLISIAQAAYNDVKHGSANTQVSSTDAKGMLAAFIAVEVAGGPNEEARRLVKAALDMANAVQHDRAATYKDAALAVEGCASVLAFVTILAGERLRTAVPWHGVTVGVRYFAWDGPTLHALEDRAPVPAPEALISELKAHGLTPSFGVKAKLRHHLAEGLVQVWETDRQGWRRELLYSADGSQVLLLKAEAV